MRRILIAVLALLVSAGPALAETRYWAFDAADRLTQALTRGLTLEVERGFFGAVRVEAIHSTTERASIDIRRGGPDAAWRALPAGAPERAVYTIGDDPVGRGLTRALCPAAQEGWLVIGRVRQGRPLTIQAVGRWPDGQFRHCATLNYTYRGEWAALPRTAPDDGASPGTR